MNNYLKQAIERYEKVFSRNGSKIYIHPMSKYDVDIYLQLIKILIKLGCPKVVLAILDEYKFKPDKNILSELEKLSEDLKNPFMDENETDGGDSKTFLSINEELIDQKYIFGIKKFDDVIKNKNSSIYYEEFSIILNPLPELDLRSAPYYADYKIIFNTELSRDSAYDNLTNNLKGNHKIVKID